jgi:hypothetical protein
LGWLGGWNMAASSGVGVKVIKVITVIQVNR